MRYIHFASPFIAQKVRITVEGYNSHAVGRLDLTIEKVQVLEYSIS